MSLREWTSSNDEVIMFIPSAYKDNETAKVLGHVWNVVNDSLSLKPVNPQAETQTPKKTQCTKNSRCCV